MNSRRSWKTTSPKSVATLSRWNSFDYAALQQS